MSVLCIWEPGTASELMDRAEGWEEVLEKLLEVERLAPPGSYYFWLVDTIVAGSVSSLEALPSVIRALGIADLIPCCTDKVWRRVEVFTIPLNRTLH